MQIKSGRSSWIAFGLFYIMLILIVSLLDSVNDVLTFSYWSAQIVLITVGVGLFALVGARLPDLSAGRSIPLAFTIGILTIIPAVLMGLGRIPGLWPQYFYIAFGMAAGSFMSFLFLKLSRGVVEQDKAELESDHFD